MKLPIDATIEADTREVIELLQNHKSSILDQWTAVIRDKLDQPLEVTDKELLDHFSMVMKFLIEELQRFVEHREKYDSLDIIFRTTERQIEGDQGAEIHGKQRASIDAYNVDKIYREYIHLREIIVALLIEHRLLNATVLQIISSVVEHCTRDSLRTFTQTIQAVQRKLLGSLVHDLRGPLNIVSISADLMVHEHDKKNIKEHKTRHKKALGRINSMIEEMLQTISIEGGQGLELSFQAVKLNKMIADLITESTGVFGDRFELINHLQDDAQIVDPQMLIRVIENLVSNAIKYGDKNRTVRITAGEDQHHIFISVHNWGNPIPAQLQKSIFRFLTMSGGRKQDKSKSWGIGLALTRATVEGHAGTITVDSNATEGTTFAVKIPKGKWQVGDRVTIKI